jgi:hypothetical protein
VKSARNVAIVLVVAAVIAFAPGGWVGAAFLSWLLGIAFLGALAWFASRLYREYRLTLYSLGDRNRAILYCAAAVSVLTFTATSRLWQTSAGVVVWFALLLGCGYAVYWVYRTAREY